MSEINPVLASFGADISGIDLAAISDDEFEWVYRAWLDYGVLRFLKRCQVLQPQQVAP